LGWAPSGEALAPNNPAPKTEAPINFRRVKAPPAPLVVAELLPTSTSEVFRSFIHFSFLNVSEHDKIFVIALRLAPDLVYTFRWPPAEMAYRD